MVSTMWMNSNDFVILFYYIRVRLTDSQIIWSNQVAMIAGPPRRIIVREPIQNKKDQEPTNGKKKKKRRQWDVRINTMSRLVLIWSMQLNEMYYSGP